MPSGKVLIVDDSDTDQYLTRETLLDVYPNLEIVQATTAERALDLLSKTADKPDVILLDINMPGMNGVEFLGEYLQQNGLCESKVFMLTSSLLEDDVEETRKYDCVQDYFPKPIRESLVQKIEPFLKSR